MMIVICSVCKKVIGKKEGRGVSQSLCETCLKAEMEKLKEEKKKIIVDH
jgi:hypothetical protein